MKYVAYYRVSTQKQGASGLGLEAQQFSVRAYCLDNLAAEFVEIESGKKSDRPQLKAAIEICKATGATLIAFKLDRLLRSLDILLALRSAKIKFTALDCLNDDDFIIQIKAAFAEEELRKVSQRTSAGLQAKKRRGETVGTPANLTAEARKKAVTVRTAKAEAGNVQAAELIKLYRAAGLTYRAIVGKLNASGYKTNRGNAWALSSVKVLDDRTIEI